MINLKRITSVALIITLMVGLCSCNSFGIDTDKYAVALAEKKQAADYSDYITPEYISFNSKLQSFSAELSDLLYREFGNENKNLCFSPVSVYMALSLAAECSGGQTRAQILSALGMSYEEVKEFTGKLYALCNNTYYYESAFLGSKKISAFSELNNSVWLDKKVGISVHRADILSKNYNSDIFGVDFEGGEAERVISEYIKDKTHGLVDGDTETDADTLFVLLSTLYLKEIWLEMGEALDKTSEKYDFENADGSIENINLLKSLYLTGKAYAGDGYRSFYASTRHGYKLHFILPENGRTISDVFAEKEISEILSLTDYSGVDDENKQIHYTRVLFPEFEAGFSGGIDEALAQGMGIYDMFSPDHAEFSGISYDGPNLYCNKILHKTKIKVDERGIEGAAFTAILGAGAAGPPSYEKVYHDFLINRAFGFVLTDSYGTVLFSGVINTK